MSRTQIAYTSVKYKASEKRQSQVETLDSWDAAIAKAKRKIKGLRQAIKTFEESKKNGEPWPASKEILRS